MPAQHAPTSRADAGVWLVPVTLLAILCLVDVAASAELILRPATAQGPLLAAATEVFGLAGTAIIRVLLLALGAGALVTGYRDRPATVAPLLRGAAMRYAVLLLIGVALNMAG